MTGLEPALYGFAIRRLTIRHTPTSIGLQCGIRTHIIPRPKRGAITRLGEPEKEWLQRVDSNHRSPAYETGGDGRTPLLRDNIYVNVLP